MVHGSSWCASDNHGNFSHSPRNRSQLYTNSTLSLGFSWLIFSIHMKATNPLMNFFHYHLSFFLPQETKVYTIVGPFIELLISVIFTWFLLSSYLLKLLVFLYFFWFDLIFYLYLSIHLCFEGLRRFQINLHLVDVNQLTWRVFYFNGPQKHMKSKGLYMQSGAKPIESSQLTSSQAWIQEKTNPIKFKSNSD